MKLSLRNLALCGSLMIAGAAFAQTPTVKMDWQKVLTTADGLKYNESRAGAGINDKFYFVNKEAQKLFVYDHATDAVSEVCTFEGAIGVGVSVDDAGNVLVGRGWAAAGSTTSFYLVNPATKEVKSLECTLPEGAVANRNDFYGRVAGNMFDPESGAIFYVWPATAENVIMYNIVNGEQNTDNFSFFTSTKTPIAGGSMGVCQPLYTYDELVDMGDDACNGAAIKQRNSNLYQFEDSKWNAYANVENAINNDGFDVFTLGDVEYRIVPRDLLGDGKYNSTFCIADMEGNIIYNDERTPVFATGTGAYTNGASILAHKINDNTVEVYTWFPTNDKHYCAKFTVSLGGDEPAPNPLYATGPSPMFDPQWDPENPMELPYANGKWTLELGNVQNFGFKVSNAKGTWDAFNVGCFVVDDANSNVIKPNVTYTVTPGVGNVNNNLTVARKGTYTLEITKEGEQYKVTLVGEPDPIEAPAATDVYLRGGFTGIDWPAVDAYKFTDCGAEGSARKYTLYVKDAISGAFKVADGSWGSVNFGVGAGTAAITIGPKYNLVYNGSDITANELADVTFIFMHSGDPDVASTLQLRKGDVGVDAIEAVEEGEATYYNLQGVKVNGKLANGVYLKVVNGKASKVLVK